MSGPNDNPFDDGDVHDIGSWRETAAEANADGERDRRLADDAFAQEFDILREQRSPANVGAEQ